MAEFLVVCDVDSTLINEEVIDMFAEAAGVRTEVADVTDRAMNGEIDFATSLTERVALLKGLSAESIEAVTNRVTLTKGARELVRQVHEADGLIVAVSGGFHEVLDSIGTDLGLDFWSANRLEIIDGVLTGRILGSIVDAQAKARILQQFAEDSEISQGRTIAVGDGANDLAMMDAAGVSVAFCAKRVVAEKADVAVDVRDLSAIVALFGRRG